MRRTITSFDAKLESALCESVGGDIYYHGTKAQHIKKIMEIGIAYGEADNTGDSAPGYVYFTADIDVAINFAIMANEGTGDGGIVVAVIKDADKVMDDTELSEMIVGSRMAGPGIVSPLGGHQENIRLAGIGVNRDLAGVSAIVDKLKMLLLKKGFMPDDVSRSDRWLPLAVCDALAFKFGYLIDHHRARRDGLHAASAALTSHHLFGNNIRVRSPVKFTGPTRVVGAASIIGGEIEKYGKVPATVVDALPDCIIDRD